jgi:putative zinc finger/helix-turn-helix YgiT family protein
MKRCVKCKANRVHPVELAETVSVGTIDFEATVDGFRCDACQEEYLDGQDAQKLEMLVSKWLAQHGVATREAFRFMRKSVGLRAADLAALLDVTPETVSHWETGRNEIPRNALAILGTIVLEQETGNTGTLDRLRLLREGPNVVKSRRVRLSRAAHA